jgi:hypothetical protein
LRSVFFCAAALPCRNTPQRAHRASQRASAMATGTMYHRARDSEPQRLQMARAAALPCASGYHRHRLRLYHGTHPTAGAQIHTDSLSTCYRHNIPSARAAALPWYTHHRHSLQRARVHIPTGTPTGAHRASQTASAMATGTEYHTHHRTASASRKKLYTKYIKYILQLFFFPSKIAETFSRICK